MLPPSSLKASPKHTEQKNEGTGKMSSLAAVELQLKIQVLPFAALCSPAATKTLLQLAVSTLLNTPVVYAVCKAFLPSGAIIFTVGRTPGVSAVITTFFYSDVFACIACGLWSGLLIGFITEYYTSHSYRPVRDVAESCRTGAATNIIYGPALGMQSTIVPVLALAATVCISFKLASQYGVAIMAWPPSACSPPSPSASPSTDKAPSATTPVALPRYASSVSTCVSALTPSTPPATPLPPTARASPPAPLPSFPSPSSPHTPCVLKFPPPSSLSLSPWLFVAFSSVLCCRTCSVE
jgi:hypothetical protein